MPLPFIVFLSEAAWRARFSGGGEALARESDDSDILSEMKCVASNLNKVFYSDLDTDGGVQN